MRKTIKSNECNGFLSAKMMSENSITIVAEIPKYARDVEIRIIGEVEANGTKFVNPVLEDIDGVIVTYHKNRTDGAIATAYFVDGIPEKLRTDVLNSIIDSFEITYTEVCPHCGN